MIHKGSEIALVAVGSMVETACEVRKILKEKGLDVTVVNERFIKPIDAGMIHKLSFDHKLIVTMEENVGLGGIWCSHRIRSHDYGRCIRSCQKKRNLHAGGSSYKIGRAHV